MLCGQAVVAIWNDITNEGRAEFYAWHITEHMPERVGIPGFLRGRRYRAIEPQARPEFFTLYELETFAVTTGKDYLSRLNAPTPWTKSATAEFRNTSRGLGRVLASVGPGSGGVIATIRCHVESEQSQEVESGLSDLMQEIVHLPMVTGAHLVATDAKASALKTVESKEPAGKPGTSRPVCSDRGVRGRQPRRADHGALSNPNSSGSLSSADTFMNTLD